MPELKNDTRSVNRRKKYAERRSANICVRCGENSSEKGFIKCAKCLEYHKKASIDSHYKRKRYKEDPEFRKQIDDAKAAHKKYDPKAHSAARYKRLKDSGICSKCRISPSLPKLTQCAPCRQKMFDMRNVREAARKLRVFNKYGGLKCACCLDTFDIRHLQIDHKNGGGCKHRKELGITGGRTFYKWLEDNNYPEGYQVLCANCNTAKGFFGSCPCQENRRLKHEEMLKLLRMDLDYII